MYSVRKDVLRSFTKLTGKHLYQSLFFEYSWRPLWPLYNWRCKDLSMSCDQIIMMYLPQWRSTLSTSMAEFLLQPKFNNSSPSVTQDIATWLWANVVTTARGGVPNGILSMIFTCCLNLMFLASLWLKIYRFWNWLFCWLWAVHSWYFANFGQVRIDPICFFLLTLDRSQLFYWVCVTHVCFSWKWPVLAAKWHTRQKIIHNSVKTDDILMK